MKKIKKFITYEILTLMRKITNLTNSNYSHESLGSLHLTDKFPGNKVFRHYLMSKRGSAQFDKIFLFPANLCIDKIPKSPCPLPPTSPFISDPENLRAKSQTPQNWEDFKSKKSAEKMSGVLRNKVQRKFKMRGYSLKVEALSEVLSFLSHFPSDASDDALELLLDELHHLSCQ